MEEELAEQQLPRISRVPEEQRPQGLKASGETEAAGVRFRSRTGQQTAFLAEKRVHKVTA
jgi:hypothetical protein